MFLIYVIFFRCDCGKLCERKSSLTQHKKHCTVTTAVADFSRSVVFSCSLCSSPFNSSRALKLHAGTAVCLKRQNSRSKSVSMTLALSETEASGINAWECPGCKASFKSKRGLSLHANKCKVKICVHFLP